MPRILQLGESRAISKTSNADFVCAVDSGIELGPESVITLQRALVHKPGADIEQAAGSITLEHEQVFQITAFVGIQAQNAAISVGGTGGTSPPERALDGLWPQTYDYKYYYATQTDTSGGNAFIEPVFIPIRIPAGTYRPSSLASIISDQTRTPVSFEDVPDGSIVSPSIILLKDHNQSPTIKYGCTAFQSNTLTLAEIYPRPIPAGIQANLAPGKNVTIDWYDSVQGNLSAPANILSISGDGLVTVSGVDFGGGSDVLYGYIYTTSGATSHDYYLRLNESDTTNQMKPTGGHPNLSREAFGSTTGISFVWNDVEGRFQMSAHSPLYNQGAVSLAIGRNAATGGAEWSGIGPRGFLAFGTDAWGFSRANWEESVWYLMGFSYDDLNGSTGRDDSSGWVKTAPFVDGSFDIAQSADALPLPQYFQSERSNGPKGEVLSLAPGVLSTPLWLIQVSILPQTKQNRWIASDGSDCSGIVGTCTKQYASGDFYTAEGGPEWVLSKKQKPFTVGSVHVRILNGLDLTTDETIGEGSTIILEVD